MSQIDTPIVVAEGKPERRMVTDTIEFREADGGASIEGYAAVFNKETVIGGVFGFREQIAPGAFDEAIVEDDVRALFNHDPNYVLGRTTNDTLKLTVDKRGLRYHVDLDPEDPDSQKVRAKVKRGTVTGSSFGFTVEADHWDERDVKAGKLPLRTIQKARLFDVSPVTYPAYTQTSVSARSKAQTIAETVESAKAAAEAAKTPERKAQDADLAALDAAIAARATWSEPA